MADISNFTHKWRAVASHDHRSDANKVTKRNRQPVSCQPCRARKLKCDRGHPCDGCLKRGEVNACIYGKTATTVSNGSATRKDETRLSAKAQDRLKHLEDLVRSMVDSPTRNQPNEGATPVLDGILQAAASDGSLDTKTITGAPYNGSTHWSAILQHISELRNDLGTDNAGDEPVPEAVDYSKPDALFGGHRPQSLEQILNNHLPPRIQIDRRITQYFNARYMIVPFLHSVQFGRQYEKFWADPLNTNVIWISKLFSICCLAASLNMAASSAPSYRAEVAQERDSFEAAAGQCLVLGSYSKPQPHVVEALALFLQCKYGRSLDPQPEVALMFGVQIRLAYMMGYHRDGSNFPSQITPFETEMRRRVWAMVRQFDLMVSFQLGIPNNIPQDSWDTKRPSNLMDSDFDENTKILPESRPETETTQILYFVVKSRLIDVYSRICHHALSFPARPASLAEIMELDKLCRETAKDVPETLQTRPVSKSVTDPGWEIMIRLNINFLWQKSLCVLHRKYMIADGNDYSHRTCIEAALAMCESFLDVYPEFQPGGTFGNDGWMLTSFTIIDFLLVSIVLCLALSVSRKKYLNGGGRVEAWSELEETSHILAVLEKCHMICIELGHRSREAKRVSGVLAIVLEKLKDKTQSKPARNGTLHPSLRAPRQPMTRQDEATTEPSSAGDKDSISMKPLSLSEGPSSENTSGGICYPPFFRADDYLYGPGRTSRARDRSESSPNALQPNSSTPSNPEATDTPQTFVMNAGAPLTFNMDLDGDFFSNFMEDPANFADIDWTQLDQFTGLLGVDPTVHMFDSMSAPTIASDSNTTESRSTDPDSSWESVPYFALGSRTFDPVTGNRQQA